MVWDQPYPYGDFLSDCNSNNAERDTPVHSATGIYPGSVFLANNDGIVSNRICGTGLLRKLAGRKSGQLRDRNIFLKKPASIDYTDGQVQSEAARASPSAVNREKIQSSNCSTTHVSSHTFATPNSAISSKSSSSSSSRSNRLQELSLQRDGAFDLPNKTSRKSKQESDLFGFDKRDDYNYLSLSRGYSSIPEDDQSDIVEREGMQSTPLFQLHTRPTSPESTTSSLSEFSVPKVILQFDPNQPFELDNSVNITHNTGDLSDCNRNSTDNSPSRNNSATAGSTTPSTLMKRQGIASFELQQIEESVSHLQNDDVSNQQHHLLTCNNVRMSSRHHYLMSRGATLPAVVEETNSFDSDENTYNRSKPDRESIEVNVVCSNFSEKVPSSNLLETEEPDVINNDNKTNNDITQGRQLASTSSQSSSNDSNNNSRGKQEIIAAMKELVTRQQETIRDLCDENLKYRDQILWFRDDIKKFKAEKHDFQQNLITLLVEKQEYEAEIQHSKQEVEKLKAAVKDIQTYLDTDMLKQFESWLKTSGGVVEDQRAPVVSNDNITTTRNIANNTSEAIAITSVATPETQCISATTKSATKTSSLEKHLPHSLSSSSSSVSRKMNQESKTIDEIVSTLECKSQPALLLNATKDNMLQDDDDDDDDDGEENEMKIRCNSSSSLESFDEQISQKWNELVALEKKKQKKQFEHPEHEIFAADTNFTKVMINPTSSSSCPVQSIDSSSSSRRRQSSVISDMSATIQDQVRSSLDSIHVSHEQQQFLNQNHVYRSIDDYSAMTAPTNNKSCNRNQLLEHHPIEDSHKSSNDSNGGMKHTVNTMSMSKKSSRSMKSNASEKRRTSRKKEDSSTLPPTNDESTKNERHKMTNNTRSFVELSSSISSSMSTTSSVSVGVSNDDYVVGGGYEDDGHNRSGWSPPVLNDKSPLHLSSFLLSTATLSLSSPSPSVQKLEPPGILSSPSVLSESNSFTMSVSSSPDLDAIKSRLGTIQRRRLRRQKERVEYEGDTRTKGSKSSVSSNGSKSTTGSTRSQVVRFSE